MPFPSAAPAQPARLEANISASQLKVFRLCRRKWWFEKVAKLREREKRHFLIGHTFHSIAERYLTRQAKTWEELFPPGWDKGLEQEEIDWARRMAEEAVTLGLWQAKDGIAIEFPIALLVGRQHRDSRGLPLLAEAETYIGEDGVRKIGKLTRLIDGRPLPADALAMPPFIGFIDELDFSYMPPGITDVKTAKSRRYALTPEKLASDTQVLCYANVPLVLQPTQDTVRLQHTVFLKDPAAKEPVYAVRAETRLPQVVEHWESVIKDGEDMSTVRQIAPVPPDSPKGQPKNPLRATNYHLVRSAIDEGRSSEACNSYGGCPFRDVCFGRCNAEQLTRRMDSPDPVAHVLEKASSFGLNLKLVPPTYRPRTGLIVRDTSSPSKESSMVFPKPTPAAPAPLAVGTHVWVIDPENSAQQYRGTVMNAGNLGVCDPMIALWPDANVEPEVSSLHHDTYVIQIPDTAALRSAAAGVAVVGYEAALKAAGLPTPGWVAKPPSKSIVGAPDAAKLEKAVSRPERDGKFGLARTSSPAAPAASATAPSAPAPTTAPAAPVPAAPAAPSAEVIPPPTFQPAAGMQVRFLPTTHSYWAAFVGRTGTILAIGDSENGPVATVDIDGLPYPNVAIGRMVPAAAPATVDWEKAKALIGQLVSVRVLDDAGVPEAMPKNGMLESLADGHIVMFGGGLKIPFTKVYAFGPFQAADMPGAKLPKPPKAPKVPGKPGRKSKAQKEAEAAAAAQAQAPAAPAPAAAAAPVPATSAPTGAVQFQVPAGGSIPEGTQVQLTQPGQETRVDGADVKAHMQDIVRSMEALAGEIRALAAKVGA